ncbi:PREDICTED: cilia- and flagella-associated protein 161 [Nicrophorus vespilloides]|uniref:Cilia- and flagella-associated protein 161 n=1 Tax=Nicrophorus vespilloides TaxID=110193 RepID=A0ABM1MW54_NICVS|nr:PREDICTED: cilia- and flagella-associated protein 161 [Nicrophorus vespilloides]
MFCGNDRDNSEFLKASSGYSAPVRIGNWNNELAIQEEKANITAYKKERCQLLVAKTRKMLKNVLQPDRLSEAIETLDYGAVYQVCAAELPNTIEPKHPKQTKGLYLSGLMDESDVDQGTNFMHGCRITASPDKIACTRNTFFFTSAENKLGNIKYGEDLFIQLHRANSDLPPLYLQAEYSTFDNFGGHLMARLSAYPDVYCHFKILHWNARMRKDSIGSKVVPNVTVIIQHIASGRNLAAEHTKWIPTFFGPECLVSCHTFQNQNRMETAENMWKIVSHRQPDKGMIIRAAKGEDIPAELLE